MVSETQVLIWTATGGILGSLATLSLINRRRINTIVQRLFGVEKDSSRGGEGHLLRVESKLDRIQSRLDDLEDRLESLEDTRTATHALAEKIYDELADERTDEDFEDL